MKKSSLSAQKTNRTVWRELDLDLRNRFVGKYLVRVIQVEDPASA